MVGKIAGCLAWIKAVAPSGTISRCILHCHALWGKNGRPLLLQNDTDEAVKIVLVKPNSEGRTFLVFVWQNGKYTKALLWGRPKNSGCLQERHLCDSVASWTGYFSRWSPFSWETNDRYGCSDWAMKQICHPLDCPHLASLVIIRPSTPNGDPGDSSDVIGESVPDSTNPVFPWTQMNKPFRNKVCVSLKI